MKTYLNIWGSCCNVERSNAALLAVRLLNVREMLPCRPIVIEQLNTQEEQVMKPQQLSPCVALV